MGLNNILTAKDLFYSSESIIDMHSQFAGLADMINIFANAPFTLLPILIGFSAAKSIFSCRIRYDFGTSKLDECL